MYQKQIYETEQKRREAETARARAEMGGLLAEEHF